MSKEENLAERNFKPKDLKYYARKMEELGFVFTPEQKALIEIEVNYRD